MKSKDIEKQKTLDNTSISQEIALNIRLDERNKIITQIKDLLNLLSVNNPKELGQLIAYNKAINVIEEGSKELQNSKSLFSPENCSHYID